MRFSVSMFPVLVGLVLTLSFILVSCAFVQKVQESDAPTCAEVQEHLTTVGCFDSLVCKRTIDKIIKDAIIPSISKGVPFSEGCDLALKTDLLPVDCVMDAEDYGDLKACIDELPEF